MLTKTKVDRHRRDRPEVAIQEALNNHIEKDDLPKVIKETLLSELKELFLPYWSDTLDNIVAVPGMDAAELVLKTIHRWSEETSSGRAAGVANVQLMEKLQTLRLDLKTANK